MKPMNDSYGRKRGDLSGAAFCGRVDVFYDGVIETDMWGRKQIKSATFWTSYGDGDSSALAKEIAERLGGEVVSEYRDALANGGRGYTWTSSPGASIVVVRAA